MKVKKKKKKLKKKNIIILVVLLLIILLFNNIRLMAKGYSFIDSFKIKELKITKEVLKRPYSKTLSVMINSKYFNINNLNDYYVINYVEDSNLSKTVFSLLENYNGEEINKILKRDPSLREYIIKNNIKDINNYLEYDYFKDNNVDRYIKFFNGDYKDTIVKVNIGIDKEPYKESDVVKQYSTDIIVNKHNVLGDNFKVKEITLLDNCSEGDNYLSIDAKKAYDELCLASIKDDMQLGVTSSYRSHEEQLKIYNSYLNSYGQNYVNKYVSTPGYSEHETGLALDVKSLNSDVFINSKEYKWMKDNAYKYGFILRYPKGKEELTGYNFESWHYRFVGKEIAKYIYENDITFEEYIAMR